MNQKEGQMMSAENRFITGLAMELRGICAATDDEAEILARVSPLLEHAAMSQAEWVEERMFETNREQGFGVHVLHEGPDRGLTIMTVNWLPQRGTPPHNHGTWAAVVGVVGDERNDFYQRVDDGSRAGHAELRRIGSRLFRPGEVVAMPSTTIHGVWNDSEAVTLSLHVYGRHPNYAGRSQFDLERGSETPFVIKFSD
jgi:predicted metal-dependent enzyme (double-stranded beta helix superfamily)